MPLGRIPLVIASLVLPLLAALPLDAQHPQARGGLTLAFGIGGGTRGLDCDECDVAREDGAAAHLFVGGTVSPRITVGAEINGWGKTEDDVEQSVTSLLAVAHVYPMVSRGLFLTGGAGITRMHVEGGPDRLTTRGFGVQVGAGYDVRVASGFSLTPYVQWVRGVAGDGELDGQAVGDANPDYLQLGVGFTWH